MASRKNGTLYTGMTNDLMRRVHEHKSRIKECFTSKYNVNQLVFFEQTDEVEYAILREKQIKGWLRAKKIKLIEETNPEWLDLSLEWEQDMDSSTG